LTERHGLDVKNDVKYRVNRREEACDNVLKPGGMALVWDNHMRPPIPPGGHL
jgi:hypothetical protein